MKEFFTSIALFFVGLFQAPLAELQPAGIFPVPDISKAEYEAVLEQIDMGRIKSEEAERYEASPIFRHFYSYACSWYCSGVVSSISATSALNGYEVEKIHDFNHESVWIEGAEGAGVGESITYTFPGDAPRITTVKILNGYVRTAEEWQEYARVKRLKLYLNDKPLAILKLKDSRSLQWFDVGLLGNDPQAKVRPDWSLKFEIMEVYPGKKDNNTAVSELYFDGIDVH